MSKKINWAGLGIALEANYDKKLKDSKDKETKDKQDSKDAHDEFIAGLKAGEAVRKKKQSVKEFKLDVRKSLLVECIYSLYNASFGNKIEYENESLIKKSLVAKFVEEEGTEKLLNSFKGKSVLLSEYASIINEYTTMIMEANEVTQSNSINQNIKDTFFDDIFGDEAKDVALSIKMRVADAIEEFNISNQEEKMDIENLIKISQDKIANATTEELKEQVELTTNRQIFKIRQRKRNIFESMVYNTSKAYFSNQAIKEQYSDKQGKLDIDKIVESCELMYTFLETVNTAKIIEVSEEYLQNFIKDFTAK